MSYSKIKYSLIAVLLLSLLISCRNKEGNELQLEQNVTYDTLALNTIAFGSCNKQWEDQSYWSTIQMDNPDLWIWMGDIIYSDTEDMDQLKQQYNIQKNHKEYQSFKDSCEVIGVWDDHDYGLNDGGNFYPKRKESRDLLFDFLDIDPDNPAWGREGAYQSYKFGPSGKQVKVFLLDGRYFRDSLMADENSEQRYLPNREGTYLGDAQWKWLEKEMAESKAQVNLIVSGIQVIPDKHFFEKWANFPNERKRLFDLIRKTGLKNPVFLSGDRHVAEFSKIEVDSTLTLFEATSSGLTHSYEKADEKNSFRIGDLIAVKNYGLIRFDWSGEKVKYRIDLKSIEGESLNHLEL